MWNLYKTHDLLYNASIFIYSSHEYLPPRLSPLDVLKASSTLEGLRLFTVRPLRHCHLAPISATVPVVLVSLGVTDHKFWDVSSLHRCARVIIKGIAFDGVTVSAPEPGHSGACSAPLSRALVQTTAQPPHQRTTWLHCGVRSALFVPISSCSTFLTGTLKVFLFLFPWVFLLSWGGN